MKTLEYLYIIIRIIIVLLLLIAMIYVTLFPRDLGIWYGEYQKGQIEAFNFRP